MSREEPAFKIKNANIPWFVLHIYTIDIERLKSELDARMSLAPDFFLNTPMVLGLAAIADVGVVPDLAGLVQFMRDRNMQAAGVIGGSDAQRAAAVKAGLGLFPEIAARPSAAAKKVMEVASEAEPVVAVEPVIETKPEDPVVIPTLKPTVFIDKPVRTGQRVYAENAHLVVLGIVNAGAELIADGDIHVYAPLRGRALAGAHGNPDARILVRQMEAELVSIDGVFQTFEHGLPEHVRGKAAQIHLDGSRLIFETLPG